MKEETLSKLPEIHNWMFLFFLGFLCLYTQLWLSRKSLFWEMRIDFFYLKKRTNPYSRTQRKEWIYKTLLSIQTTILLSIILCRLLNFSLDLKFTTLPKLFLNFGYLWLLIAIHFLYKIFFHLLIGELFFDKKDKKSWNKVFFSIFSLCGLGLFIPAIWIFYEDDISFFCFYTNTSFLFFIELWIIYKAYILFFSQKSKILYFILYLCALESFPVYFVIFFLKTTKNTLPLWL